MTEITKEILESELRRYKMREGKKWNSYRKGQTAVIRRLLEIMDKGYDERKE